MSAGAQIVFSMLPRAKQKTSKNRLHKPSEVMAPQRRPLASGRGKENSQPKQFDRFALVRHAAPRAEAVCSRKFGGVAATTVSRGRATATEARTSSIRPGPSAGARQTADARSPSVRRGVRTGMAPSAEEVAWRAAADEAARLEAVVVELDVEIEAVRKETDVALIQEQEKEKELTSRSAELLTEYASGHEAFMSVEAELTAALQHLEAKRAETLELSRRTLDLDREGHGYLEVIAKVEAVSAKCANSRDDLEEEIAQSLVDHDRHRDVAESHCHTFAAHLQRLAKLRASLTGVCTSVPSADVARLLEEADHGVLQTEEALRECGEEQPAGFGGAAAEPPTQLATAEGRQPQEVADVPTVF